MNGMILDINLMKSPLDFHFSMISATNNEET
jgi:hypothetical protein